MSQFPSKDYGAMANAVDEAGAVCRESFPG